MQNNINQKLKNNIFEFLILSQAENQGSAQYTPKKIKQTVNIQFCDNNIGICHFFSKILSLLFDLFPNGYEAFKFWEIDTIKIFFLILIDFFSYKNIFRTKFYRDKITYLFCLLFVSHNFYDW